MKNRCRKALWTILLMAITMIAVCQIAWAESGFVEMKDGATSVVGEPYTIKFVPGYYSSSGTLIASIRVNDPDGKSVLSEDIPYKTMYETIEVTITPEKVGTYKLEGYCSLQHKVYISRYPVEKSYIATDKNTKTMEAILLVTQKKSKEKGSQSEEGSTALKAPASVKVKAKKNKVTVSWKKLGQKDKKLKSQIKSIEVQYATDKAFTQNAVTKSVGKNKTKVVLNLKNKTPYFIRVRYIGKDGSASPWSGVKRVKTK